MIFDEIHHGGDAKSWGDSIREAFGDAPRRLALTGTPFRSDDAAIPFVRYEPDGNGLLRSAADHTYGYADALADGVVRPVVFLAYSGETRWRTVPGPRSTPRGSVSRPAASTRARMAHRAGSGRRVDARGDLRRRHPAEPTARRRSTRCRRHDHRVGSEVRPRLCVLLPRLTGEAATVVLSDDPGSRIASQSSPRAPAAGWSRCGWSPRASTSPDWP